MEDLDTSLPKLGRLVEQRLELARELAGSLESSTLALARRDAEAIARGAAHQAELCRQWSLLESGLRRPAMQAAQRRSAQDARELARLEAEWEALAARIRHLARVHWSLLRHLERSLAIVNRVVCACSLTYTSTPGAFRSDGTVHGSPAPAGPGLDGPEPHGEMRCQV